MDAEHFHDAGDMFKCLCTLSVSLGNKKGAHGELNELPVRPSDNGQKRIKNKPRVGIEPTPRNKHRAQSNGHNH